MKRTSSALAALALCACQPVSVWCEEWIACEEAFSAEDGTIPQGERNYGAGSTCWTTPGAARSCAEECVAHLMAIRAMRTELPRACNPITPMDPPPYPPLPPPGPCSAPRVLDGGTYGAGALEGLDVNDDGTLDLLVADWGGNLLHVFRGDGTGRFTRTSNALSSISSRELGFADVDGDGAEELMLLAAEHVVAYELPRDGTLGEGVWSAGFPGTDAVYADLTGDGHLDVFVVGSALDGLAWLGVGRGDGTFAAPTRLAPGRQISLSAPIDLEDDGDVDVLTWFYEETLGVARNDGAGGLTFETVPGISLAWAQHLEVGDLDGDGHDDVVLVGIREVVPDAPSFLSVSFGDGLGGLVEEQLIPFGDGAFLWLDDLDGDARPDIVTSGMTSGLTFRTVGVGRAVSEPIATPVTRVTSGYAAHDVDGDGGRDFLWTSAIGSSSWSWPSVTIEFSCRAEAAP